MVSPLSLSGHARMKALAELIFEIDGVGLVVSVLD
jgi:hypothetical protein